MPETKLTKAERTRQYIIEKVAPIFNSKGFAGTSLSDLTQATGLTKGAIYGNFKNKDEIALEAFEYNFSVLANGFMHELSMVDSAFEKLMRIPLAYKNSSPSVSAMGGCPLLNTITDTDDSDVSQELKMRSVKALTMIKESIEALVVQAIADKSVKPDTDPDEVAALILSLVEGCHLISKAMKNERYFDSGLQEITYLIERIKI